MYRDEKKIKIVPLNENLNLKDEKLLAKYEFEKVEKIIDNIKSKKKVNFIRIGFENYQKVKNLNPDKNFPWPCDIVFYKQFNIPFKYRFSKCYWKRDKKREGEAAREELNFYKKYFTNIEINYLLSNSLEK